VPAYAVVSRSGELPRGDAEGEVIVLAGTPGEVLEDLAGRGLTRVVCEGGPSWLGQVAAAGRLDELCLTVSPQLAGPGRAGLLQGPAWSCSRPLRLTSLLEDGGWLFARYALEEPSTSPEASSPASAVVSALSTSCSAVPVPPGEP
jgi:riboflavin biosynthesis pyrimidine reductase